MFKARAPPKGKRRKKDDSDEEKEEEGEVGEQELEKLAEVRLIQKEQWRKPRGVVPVPEMMKQPEEEEEEEDKEQWGLLDKSFAGVAGAKGPDHHMEAYINERLYDQKKEVEVVREKTREEKLYELPQELEVNDFTIGQEEKMSWVSGLAEVALPVEYKLKNIEATEKAKREYLYGEGSGTASKSSVLEPDAVTRKAFGSRFMSFNDRNDSKSASDDAALERFRKRMRQ
eukprot:TRINITY_DN30235_c0_g2_i1.p1 TRINITY_DN30235_c0_g2~~TRINITY_DN30235_c0_g2_i1.p1  ORF type:complete len:238 (-),score=91.71 TRINITY_DN30235_c0_g2_i1:99-785(-)